MAGWASRKPGGSPLSPAPNATPFSPFLKRSLPRRCVQVSAHKRSCLSFSNIADIERVSAEVLADLSDRINVSSFPDHDESDESDDFRKGRKTLSRSLSASLGPLP